LPGVHVSLPDHGGRNTPARRWHGTQVFTSISELIELGDVDKGLLAKIRPALTVGPPK
jgi:hypothetical protein